MASTDEFGIGARLAAIRRACGLTADALADLIPDGLITKNVIANIESGRKPDPSVTDVMRLASALHVSPLALMIDVDDPAAPVPVPGLAKPIGQLTSIEYGRAAAVFGPRGVLDVGFRFEASRFVSALIEAEVQAHRIDYIEGVVEDDSGDIDGAGSSGGRTGTGEEWWVSAHDESAEGLSEARQTLIAAYRDALRAAETARWGPRSGRGDLPEVFAARLERIRLKVVQAIETDGGLDYGRDDGRQGRWSREGPPLDPKTGRVSGRWRLERDTDVPGWRSAGQLPPVGHG